MTFVTAVLFAASASACGDEDSGITPTPGDWRGDQAAFHLEGDVLSEWWLQGMFCESAEGQPICLVVPQGVPEASTALEEGSFSLNVGELSVVGTFTGPEQVSGSWRIERAGCCSASGTWSATLHEALVIRPAEDADAPSPGLDGSASPPGPIQPTPGPGALQSADEACSVWSSAREDMSEAQWFGDASTCDPSDIDDAARARVLRQVNLYRTLTGLPALELDEDYNALAQSCSVLMDANGTIDHVPPETWACYSWDGAKGASESNLASAPALAAVDLYMGDLGNETTLGHRRWILQNGLGPIGVGSTNEFSCLHVLGSKSVDDVQWTAWPPAGFFPSGALFTLAPIGWSFHSHIHASLEGAAVNVTRDGEELAVDTWPLSGGYGGSEAIAFRPEGWSPEAGATYSVAVTGITPPVSYSVNIALCP